MRFILLLLIFFPAGSPPAFSETVCLDADRVAVRIRGPVGQDDRYAEMLCEIRPKLREKTGLDLDFPVTLHLYQRRDEFQKAAGNAWMAAYAVPGANVMAFDDTRTRQHPLEFPWTLLHESSHLLLHRHISRDRLPKWFDEGVAQWVSGGARDLIYPGAADPLKRAVVGGRLIPFYRLNRIFPTDGSGLALAYEQSGAMVTYLAEEHGPDAVRKIIGSLASGVTFDEAIRAATGKAFHELEADWRQRIRTRYTWVGFVADRIYWLVFVLAGLVTVVGFVRVVLRMRNYTDDEEEESEKE